MKYIIYDTINHGYVLNDPIEGWIFTIIKNHATRFETKEHAQKIIDKYCNNSTLIIEEI